MIGINIFAQPTLGMLNGLIDIDTRVVSCYSSKPKINGKVFKFAYNISKETLNGLKADIVYGIIHKFECQVREHMIPNKESLFDSIIDGPSERLRIHRSAIHESIIIANVSEASQILLYFLSDPFADEGTITRNMFKREWKVRLFKIALFGDVTPTPYIWAIHAIRGKGEGEMMKIDDRLVIDLPAVKFERSINKNDSIIRSLLWDLSPWLCKEVWQLIKSTPITEEWFCFFKTSAHVGRKLRDRVLQGGDLYDLTNIDMNSSYINSLSVHDWAVGLGWLPNDLS